MFRCPRTADFRDDHLTTPMIMPNKTMQRSRIHSVVLSGFSGPDSLKGDVALYGQIQGLYGLPLLRVVIKPRDRKNPRLPDRLTGIWTLPRHAGDTIP
jgi:hypothetical protein